jgi:type III secretion protein Q
MNATTRPAGKSIRRLVDLEAGRELPEVAPHSARLSRTLCDARLRNWLAQAHGVAGWRAVDKAARTDARTGWVELRCAGGGARIGFDPALYPALASAAAHSVGDADSALSATLRNAVATMMLAPALDVMQDFGDDMHIASLRDDSDAADRRAASDALTVRFTHDGRSHECLFAEIDASSLALVDDYLASLRVPLSRSLSEIPVPGCARLGETLLAVHTLERLRPGDVLLGSINPELSGWFDRPAQPLGIHVLWGLAGARRLGARATLDGTRLVLNSDPIMTQDAPPPDAIPSADETTSLDTLQLPVTIEVETVKLPLVQLSALRAGYVLELPTAVRDARVRLMSYGQMIGSGELVSVGDQLGVRIIQMSGAHDPVQ